MSEKWKSILKSSAVRFVGLFFLLVLVLTLVLQVPWVDSNLVGPYVKVLASIGGTILGILQVESDTVGTIIRQGRFAVDIRRGCDGIVASILLISACLAYPFSWRDRVGGVLWGYLLIFVLNMIRIVGLFWLGVNGSVATFNFFHTYVSQFAVIALTMVFWVYWASTRQDSAQPN